MVVVVVVVAMAVVVAAAAVGSGSGGGSRDHRGRGRGSGDTRLNPVSDVFFSNFKTDPKWGYKSEVNMAVKMHGFVDLRIHKRRPRPLPLKLNRSDMS